MGSFIIYIKNNIEISISNTDLDVVFFKQKMTKIWIRRNSHLQFLFVRIIELDILTKVIIFGDIFTVLFKNNVSNYSR